MPTGFENSPLASGQGDEAVINLEDVAVLFRVPRERVSGIKEFAIRWMQRRLEYEEFLALKDISFQVRRGEVFGVIGRNGSGKSTLLKVIARVLVPTRGRVRLRGRVAPLLELGAGFQAELTGRENIFLNSALLGRTQRETERLLPDIIDFAEIGDFIDAPLRTYSSGMVARLGFAVATCIRPDILLVDEVLSVGDAQFQQKCLERMNSYQEQGTTILIVSHSMATIEEFCGRALWLDHGRLMAIGAAPEVVASYIQADRPEIEPASSLPLAAAPPLLEVAQPIHSSQGYAALPDSGKLYNAASIFRADQGTVSVWLRFSTPEPGPDCVLFHTDDSRYVLYLGQEHARSHKRTLRAIRARAGGNRRSYDPYYGTSNYPEASALIDDEESLPAETWRLVAMTWSGYPEGVVRLYLDGNLVDEKTYTPQNDNGHPLASSIAVGTRPTMWMGELLQNEDGSLVDSRPYSTMSIEAGGVEMRDMRLFPRCLSPEEMQALLRAAQAEAYTARTP